MDGGLLFAKTTLIVCPASLVHQWYKEIENRVEKMQLRVCLYHGSNRETRVKKLVENKKLETISLVFDRFIYLLGYIVGIHYSALHFHRKWYKKKDHFRKN